MSAFTFYVEPRCGDGSKVNLPIAPEARIHWSFLTSTGLAVVHQWPDSVQDSSVLDYGKGVCKTSLLTSCTQFGFLCYVGERRR